MKIDQHSEDELKDCLKQILSTVNSVRTLDEMLNDYTNNYQKYELKKNRNAPKLPANPYMSYVAEHRKELLKKLTKKYPNETIKLVNTLKIHSLTYY